MINIFAIVYARGVLSFGTAYLLSVNDNSLKKAYM